MAAADVANKDDQASYWELELSLAKKRWNGFHTAGENVVDQYRLEKGTGADLFNKDKYNILYSSTETIRPNLYAQTPKPRCELMNKDRATKAMRVGAMLLEGNLKYLQKSEDFDDLMGSVVEDYLLPGMGNAFVRYEATVEGEGENAQKVDEMVHMDYVYWRDFLCGVGRVWKDVPWVAKCLHLNKEKASKRFGKDKAALLTYKQRDTREQDSPADTAEVWEIWCKSSRKVYWYAEGLASLLDEKEDPLKLEEFFPCPRPLRAVTNTRTIVPRSLYSQYRSQAETLNVMTKRIRLLSEALKVVGVYDGSMVKLSDILNANAGNRMIAVDNWAMFAQNGGMTGAVQWVPIDAVVKTLNELLQAREVIKQEIYEITGFSDVVRGVSKASETLGAQNLKANWAGARVKKQQAEVQRFARDLLALAGELIAEHCEPTTIAMFSGLPIPTAEQIQANPSLQEDVKVFTEACGLIRNEIRRVSSIGIETDSTLLADYAAEREDRTNFLAAAGAFLQQAVPAIEQAPELAGLLGSMLMFTIRTFPASRSIEDDFEKVAEQMQARLAQPQEQDKDGKKAAANAAAQKAQSDAAIRQQELQVQQAEAASNAQTEQAKVQLEQSKEQNRHGEKMAEIALKEREVALKERELTIKEAELRLKEAEVGIKQQQADTQEKAAERQADNADTALAVTAAGQERQEGLERDKLASADDNAEAERESAAHEREEKRKEEAKKPPAKS